MPCKETTHRNGKEVAFSSSIEACKPVHTVNNRCSRSDKYSSCKETDQRITNELISPVKRSNDIAHASTKDTYKSESFTEESLFEQSENLILSNSESVIVKESANDNAKETLFAKNDLFETPMSALSETVASNLSEEPCIKNTADTEAAEEISGDSPKAAKKKSIRARRAAKKQALADATEKSIKSGEYIFNEDFFGRRMFFRMYYLKEEEFAKEWDKNIPITSVCTSLDALKSANEPDTEQINAFLEQVDEYFGNVVPHLGRRKREDMGYFTVLRIMVPHDLPEDKYKEFLKGFIELTPYEDGMPFIAAKTTQGNGVFLNVFINERQYFGEERELPVYTAKKDCYYSTATGRACKADDPNAKLKYPAGTVIRKIMSRFGFKKSFKMKKEEFRIMRQAILEYMRDFFDENGCNSDDRIKLGHYEGKAVEGFDKSVRHQCASYTGIFRTIEDKMTELYYFANNTCGPEAFRRDFKDTVKAMRRTQMFDIVIPRPGEPVPPNNYKFKDGKTTDYFYNAVSWAASMGITKGTSATMFGPKQYCLREQVVTFLYRFSRLK